MEENKQILLLEETVAQLSLRNRVISRVIELMDMTLTKNVLLERVAGILEEAIRCFVKIMVVDEFTGKFFFYPEKKEDSLTDEDTKKHEFIINTFKEIEEKSSPIDKPGFMCFPIGSAGNIKGVIAAFGDTEENFSPHETRLFKEVAELLKRILENTLLINDMNKSLIKMQGLFNAVKELSGASNYKNLLNDIVSTTMAIIECEGSSVLLLNDKKDKLRFAAVSGEHKSQLAGFEFPKEEGIAGWALEQKREGIVNEVSQSPYFSSRVDEVVGSTTRNLIVVPIGPSDEPVGVMEAVNKLDGADFSSQDILYFSILASQAYQIIEKVRLYDELNATFSNTVTSIIDAVEFGAPMTMEHSRSIQKNALDVALALGINAKESEEIALAALLHDVGKIGVPDAILQKCGPLSDDEWQIIKKHPDIGVKILEPIKSLEKVIPYIRHHHERWDGSGYPVGLAGDKIPLGARIIAVCDAFDAMISERNYGRKLSKEAALEEIIVNSGKQFDPECVKAAIPILKKIKK